MGLTRREMMKGIGTATAAGILTAAASPVNAMGAKPEVKKGEDAIASIIKTKGKDFKILQITDVQLGVPDTIENEIYRQIKELVKKTQPDVIISTGDNLQGPNDEIIIPKMVEFLDSLNIPWTTVYGNHDCEGYKGLAWQSEQFENGRNCLFKSGPGNVEGYGNHAINIMEDGKPFYSLYMLDSHAKDVDRDLMTTYGFIRDNQIQWYENMVQKISKQSGKIVPSLMFFHIPLPEYKDAYNLYEESGFSAKIGKGRNYEGVCSSRHNSGLFDKIKQLKSTKGTFVGHDHVNASAVLYKDVLLTYGLKTACGSYWKPEMQGGTLITIKDGSKELDVEFVYVDNKKYRPLTDVKKISKLLDGKVTTYEADNKRVVAQGYTMAGDPWKNTKAMLANKDFTPEI
ncbi:metallophosphoesterase family protein [Desulfoluna spongiiphila]|uniref:metallophosphoesterase family protein n=1 Tax=Desulfoluna spongiiphila TaxID=419481 RepID=UPI001258AFA4|nr:metallophosphoesterase family protein [Desulfoluna spongiiphila]VVS93643.1 twin-arginine translocation pathway signal sequence [Desulfoluna spongiiphila]